MLHVYALIYRCACYQIPSPSDYILLNIEPVFTSLKAKTQTWARLPLGVMGRIFLMKMILLPKILYILWHSPVYIPNTFFKTMDTILQSFV